MVVAKPEALGSGQEADADALYLLSALCGNSSLCVQCEHPCPAEPRHSYRINLVILRSQETREVAY